MARGTALILRLSAVRFVLVTSGFTCAASVFIALYCFAGQAFTGDEMAMNWHARMLMAGHLSIPRPEHSEFFNTFGIMDRGPRWFSQFPIGGPALHAIGIALTAPWLVNPVLLGLATWQLYRFTRLAFGEHTARMATLLFALSPFVLALGSTQLTHTPTLLLTLIALAELARWDREDERSVATRAALVGLAVGAIALIRPYDAVLVALPIGAFQLARAFRSTEHLRSLAIQCAAGAIPVVVLLWANAHTTGHPLLFAYDAAHGPAHGVGFHVDPMGQPHTPRRGVVFVSGYLLRFNRFLFEWPIPGMAVVVFALVTLRRATRWDTLLLGLVGSFLVGYWAYWYNGFFDGPRFLLPVTPVFILAAARLPEAAAGFSGVRQRVLRVLVPACVLCAWFIPLSFTSVFGRLTLLRAERSQFKVNVAAELRRARITNALVFVQESWHERLTSRLEALGVPMFDAKGFVDSLDACVLQLELDAADAATSADTAALRARILERAAAAGPTLPMPDRVAETRIARAPNGPNPPRCQEEAAKDLTSMRMPYAIFLLEQQVDGAGHLAGPVIFARDFGARDTLLRQAYGSRDWYRYEPGGFVAGQATFVPMTKADASRGMTR
jgi:Alg9-like mannosyltransferase family